MLEDFECRQQLELHSGFRHEMLGEEGLAIKVPPVEIEAPVPHEADQHTVSCAIVHKFGVFVKTAEDDALDQLCRHHPNRLKRVAKFAGMILNGTFANTQRSSGRA